MVLGWFGGSFDPDLYIFLNPIPGTVAALQAPVIMMTQNRNAAKDRVAAAHDYEVSLKADPEILALHRKFDILQQAPWAELMTIRRDQIQLLTRLLAGREPPPPIPPGPEETMLASARDQLG